MADNERQKLTAKERQIARINQLKAQLQKEEAKLRAEARKERNAQLIAFGIFFEIVIREESQENFENVKEALKGSLKGRILEQALAGMTRLAKEREELAKTSSKSAERLPEPPTKKKGGENP